MAQSPEDAQTDDDGDFVPRERRRLSLPAGIAIVALLACAYFFWDLLPAFRYWASRGEAVDLGRPGDYHLERESDGLYARFEGVSGPGASLRVRRMGLFETRYDVIVARDTNILLRRSPQEGPAGAALPFAAQGRLVLDRSLPDYGPAFQSLTAARGGAQPREGHLYVLLDGERPRTGWAIPLQAAGLLALILLNAASLARYGLALRRSVGGGTR